MARAAQGSCRTVNRFPADAKGCRQIANLQKVRMTSEDLAMSEIEDRLPLLVEAFKTAANTGRLSDQDWQA
jgi:hypothetical protein